jgi:secretion/DNA translocation related TadE-like protein
VIRHRLRLADERGSATVWVLAFAGVLALVGAAVVLTGAAVVARHRATAAADLAALAGAGRAVVGERDPCAAVARVASANHASVDGCAIRSDAVVEVRLHVDLRLGPLGVVEASARARAGPAPVAAVSVVAGDE